MLRDIFSTIGGTNPFGILSMIIFVAFFVFLIINTVTLKAKDVEDFSRLPFEDNTKEQDDIHEV